MAAMFDGFHPLSSKPGHFLFDSFNLFVLNWDFKNYIVLYTEYFKKLHLLKENKKTLFYS